MSYRALKLYAYIVLFSVVLMTFMPVAGNDFVNWDDYEFVKNNPFISRLDARTFLWSATSFFQGAWHPVTWLSHALDVRLWGYDPAFHHLMGAILHAVNVLLLCALFVKLGRFAGMTQDAAYIAAFAATMLFGVHPLRVESVAWLSARKDLLCAFFFILSVAAYLNYADAFTMKNHRVYYGLSLISCAMALMSKAVAMTLPLVLIIIDYYPLKRLTRGTAWRLALEKAPFFALAVGAGLLNLLAAEPGAVPFSYVPLSARVMNSFYALIFYIQRSFFPTEFIPLYQLDRSADFFGLPYVGSAFLVILISAFCVWRAFNGDRALSALWAFYIAVLGPTLGLFMSHRHAVADRYSYLPTSALWLLVGIGIARLNERAGRSRRPNTARVVIGLVLAGTVIGLASVSVRQIGVWKNTESLWGYIVENAQHVPAMAYAGLASEHERRFELDKALELYQKAFTLNPRNNQFKGKIADVLSFQGKKEEALAIHEEILREEPENPMAHANVARMLGLMGRWDEALAAAEKALAIDAHNRQALLLMSALLMDMKAKDKAREYYRKYLDFGYLPDLGLEVSLGLRPPPSPRRERSITETPPDAIRSSTGP
jgi:hypothetical protein